MHTTVNLPIISATAQRNSDMIDKRKNDRL